MGTVLPMTAPARRPRRPASAGLRRASRRWRFHPRGLLGLVLAAVFAINLYTLADGVVSLIKSRRDEAALRQRQARQLELNRALQRDRDWMAGRDYLREQARNLGYTSPDEPVVSPDDSPPPAESPVKRRRNRPCPPY